MLSLRAILGGFGVFRPSSLAACPDIPEFQPWRMYDGWVEVMPLTSIFPIFRNPKKTLFVTNERVGRVEYMCDAGGARRSSHRLVAPGGAG
jgi:hypothetical protein